jgi:hypothetical protein
MFNNCLSSFLMVLWIKTRVLHMHKSTLTVRYTLRPDFLLFLLSPPPPHFIFGSTGVWTQGLELTEPSLYNLSHVFEPFCFSYFLNKFSHSCPGWLHVMIIAPMHPMYLGSQACATML